MDILDITNTDSIRSHRALIKESIKRDTATLQEILPDVPEISRLFGAILENEILLSNLNLLEQSKTVGEMPSEKFSALLYAIKREIQALEHVSKLVSRPVSPAVSSQSALGVY